MEPPPIARAAPFVPPAAQPLSAPAVAPPVARCAAQPPVAQCAAQPAVAAQCAAQPALAPALAPGVAALASSCWLLDTPHAPERIGVAVGAVLGVLLLGALAVHYCRPVKSVL
mmetsp:Transcript_27959/g.68958  ORF Transcript_27959/g.68958 Transcript_27959/m.68958 type:complete len:113 (-) Transcript_27959:448-786(-)